MDIVTVDVTDIPDIQFGNWVEFWSPKTQLIKYLIIIIFHMK